MGGVDSLGCRGVNCMDWAVRLGIGAFWEGLGLVQLVCVFGDVGIEWADLLGCGGINCVDCL